MFVSSALSKRASYPKQAIVIVIRFFIIYYSTCFYHCQLDKGPILRSILQSMSLTTFDFYGLRIYKYGLFFQIAQRIKCIQIIYVSLIRKMISLIEQIGSFFLAYFSTRSRSNNSNISSYYCNSRSDSRSNHAKFHWLTKKNPLEKKKHLVKRPDQS